jgi:hypothetical protein
MTKSSDDRLVAQALRAARKSANFDTAESAALHFGWPVARYRAHESGTRHALDDDLKKYAQGFGLAVARLAKPDPRELERKLSGIREAADNQTKQIANRLRCARILRGYRSARIAATAVGLKTPTYLKHENGQNRLSGDVKEFYAQVFKISVQWLQTGQLPSGFGRLIDEKIRSVLEHPERYVSQVEVSARSPPASDLVDLKPGRPQKRTLKITEYCWSELERNGGVLSNTLPHGLATFPMLASEESGRSMIFSVVVDKPGCQLTKHSRVLVSAGGGTEEGDYLILYGEQLGVFSLRLGQARRERHRILGRVIGRLENLSRE